MIFKSKSSTAKTLKEDVDAESVDSSLEELLDKLRKHHLYACDYHFTIEKTNYIAIVFEKAYTIYSIVHRIEHGLYYNLLYEDKLKILNFWEADCNSNIHKYLFNENIIKVKPICENITKYT